MSTVLDTAVVQIRNQGGATVGTGFLITPTLVVTCAHVVESAGAKPGQPVDLALYRVLDSRSDEPQLADVLSQGWSPGQVDDHAFLRLRQPIVETKPVRLGYAVQTQGHSYVALGFPVLAGYTVRWGHGTIKGVVPGPQKRQMLEIDGDDIKGGMSGAPVLDRQTGLVVGMVSEYASDEAANNTPYAWATTAETIRAAAPSLLEPNPNPRTDHERQVLVFELLEQYFNIEELQALCLRLGVDHEQFRQVKGSFNLDLVAYVGRRPGMVEKLIQAGRTLRPDLNWPYE